MIKNVHYNTLPLRWGDDYYRLDPGEELPRSKSGWDDGIEKYFLNKLGPKEIELLPEPQVTEVETPEVVEEETKKTTVSKKK